MSLNPQFCLNFLKFLKFPSSQLMAQVVLLLKKAHPLQSQLAGTSPVLFLKNLLYLKLLHLSLVAEVVIVVEEDEEAEVVVDEVEAEVVAVDEVLQLSAAAVPQMLLLLPLRRAAVGFEAEAVVVVVLEISLLLQFVHSTIVDKN